MISNEPARNRAFEAAQGGAVDIDVSRDFMKNIKWDGPLRKLPWRTIRGSDSLKHAAQWAAWGSPAKWELAAGCSVPFAQALDLPSPDGAASGFAKGLVWRREYWAAPIDVVAIPRATYFPGVNLVVNSAANVWEELDYATNMRDIGVFAESDNGLVLKPYYQKLAREAPQIPGVTWICGDRFYRNYTHWHTEVLSQLMNLDDPLPDGVRFAFQSLDDTRRHSLLATGRANRGDIVLEDTAHHFEIALVATQSVFRTWLHPAIAAPLRDLANVMRGRVAASPSGRRPVYISRLDAGARPMTNEADLCAALEAAGVEIVTANRATYEQQVAIYANASVLIGAHGSGLTNMIYCPEGTPVIELRPMHAGGRSPLWDISYRILSSIMGIPYGLVVFENPVDSDPWQVDVAFLLEALRKFGVGARERLS